MFTLEVDSKIQQKFQIFLLKEKYGTANIGNVTISWQLIPKETNNEVEEIVLNSSAINLVANH